MCRASVRGRPSLDLRRLQADGLALSLGEFDGLGRFLERLQRIGIAAIDLRSVRESENVVFAGRDPQDLA